MGCKCNELLGGVWGSSQSDDERLTADATIVSRCGQAHVAFGDCGGGEGMGEGRGGEAFLLGHSIHFLARSLSSIKLVISGRAIDISPIWSGCTSLASMLALAVHADYLLLLTMPPPPLNHNLGNHQPPARGWSPGPYTRLDYARG